MRTLEIADYLGVTRQRVTQLASHDGFPAPRMVGGRRLWKKASIGALGRSALVGNSSVED
jgi:excisionase family DNA binding protein